jgi:aspartyl-tRNA(Asn)/glutamyl-tRNA(Gln) amidotransferase subunit C
MKITAQEVQKVAELARLDIDDDQVEPLADQLAAILDYMDKLSEVDTSDIKPTAHAIELTNAFREDDVHEHLDRDKGLANAPQKEEGSFVVPKVI